MSRRSSSLDVLVGHLIAVAVVSAAVGLLIGWLTSWPVEVAGWLSGFAAGAVAAPLLRAWLAWVADRLSGQVAIRGARPRTGTRSRTRRAGR